MLNAPSELRVHLILGEPHQLPLSQHDVGIDLPWAFASSWFVSTAKWSAAESQSFSYIRALAVAVTAAVHIMQAPGEQQSIVIELQITPRILERPTLRETQWPR